MKILCAITNVKVLTKEATPSRDNTATYYKLGIMSGNELGNVSCSEDVYNNVQTDKVYDIACTYNSEYKSFKLDKVLNSPVPKH